jgi:hypothetical protein
VEILTQHQTKAACGPEIIGLESRPRQKHFGGFFIQPVREEQMTNIEQGQRRKLQESFW